MTFTKEFSGNLNKGINELKTEREEKRKKEADEWAQKEIEKIRRQPKF